MEPNRPPTSADWLEHERLWRKRLGRLRLGVEPLDEQLTRHRHVAWGLTIVAGTVGLLFVALFTAFQSPLIGMAVVAILLGPVVVLVWLEFARMQRMARLYEQERRALQAGSRPSDAPT